MNEKPTITFRLGDDFYEKLDCFTRRIINDGYDQFSDEFRNIDSFYCWAVDDDSARSDRSFRITPKPFYLIEALYFQIFDQANREAFNRAKDTVLILPDCMSLLLDRCKKKKTRFGKICTRCTPKCMINQIMQIADRYHIEGYFSKRELEEQLGKIKKVKPDLGVIGISCLLTMASGMRSAKEVGIPARGVFLNFTGCEHWSDKPFSTETSLKRLQSILEEKYGAPHSPS
nr:DUF116 domain-containing protein [candidate division Zixibacteria bacterium]